MWLCHNLHPMFACGTADHGYGCGEDQDWNPCFWTAKGGGGGVVDICVWKTLFFRMNTSQIWSNNNPMCRNAGSTCYVYMLESRVRQFQEAEVR